VNEYTRREEVRWTLIASLAMVLCIAPAVIILVTAQGKWVPDQAARQVADQAAEKAKASHPCVVAAEKLGSEIEVFKASAKAAHLNSEEDPDAKKKPKTLAQRAKDKLKEKENQPDVNLAWTAAQPSQKAAKVLASCRANTEASAGVRPEAGPAWEAIAKAAAVAPATDDKTEELAASRTLLKLLSDIPVDKVVQQAKDAEAANKAQAEQAEATADKAQVREPIQDHLIPRRLAVGIGVGLSVIALLLSYLSVRVASNRRLSTLIPLREAAKTNQPGLHAAAVLRLASQGNGGLPGAVIGGALGGLVAAAIQPLDTDVFIGGVMAGFLLGLGVQFLLRMAAGASRWRGRTQELAEIEKPAIPIVLVLSGVNPGLEAPFITFFTGLSEPEAASTVEKLAAQAEERILAAADAGAAQPGGMPPGGMPPGGMPPGGMPPGGMPPGGMPPQGYGR
jgi:chemotaxis protein histidine kinase CheA